MGWKTPLNLTKLTLFSQPLSIFPSPLLSYPFKMYYHLFIFVQPLRLIVFKPVIIVLLLLFFETLLSFPYPYFPLSLRPRYHCPTSTFLCFGALLSLSYLYLYLRDLIVFVLSWILVLSPFLRSYHLLSYPNLPSSFRPGYLLS